MEHTADAEFEALFTEEYWRDWREAAEHQIALTRAVLQAEGIEHSCLADHLEEHITERPAYLTNVSPRHKEALRQLYHEVYAQAQRTADAIGTCACGSANLAFGVGVGGSKFKQLVTCTECEQLLYFG